MCKGFWDYHILDSCGLITAVSWKFWIQALWLSRGSEEGRASVWINKRPAQPAHSAIASHDHLFYV